MLTDRLPSKLISSVETGELPDDEEGSQVVKAPRRMATLLLRTLQQHNILTVRVAGSNEYFSSAVLEVVPEQHYLVLDELSPKDGHALMEVGRSIHVSTRLSGIRLNFDSYVSQVDEESDIAFYKVPFPDALNYCQRRNHLRVSVPAEKHVRVQLLTEAEILLSGELRDISAGGANIRLHPGNTASAQVGTSCRRCVIDLPETGKICAEFEICYADEAGKLARPRIGGRFIGLEPTQKRDIEYFVAALDRDQAKKAIGKR